MNLPAAVLTEEEKQAIINAAKGQYTVSIKERRVEAVLVHGVVLYGNPPSFYFGWASGTTGHWGIVVYGELHHLIYRLDDNSSQWESNSKVKNSNKNGLTKEK